MAAILTSLDCEGRPLRRRDPPREPRDRGDPLPGARGLPARHRRRPGSGRADADARPAAFTLVGATTRTGLLDHASARPLRDDLQARLLRAGRARDDRAPLGRHPRRRQSRTRLRTRSLAARAGRRGSRTASCGASATSPRCDTPARSRSRSHARLSSCSRSTRPGSSGSTASSSPRSRTSSAAARSGCRRWRCPSARSRTRSRTSTSRTSCSSASSSERREDESSPQLGRDHIGAETRGRRALLAMSAHVWTPGAAGPLDEFVQPAHRMIAAFASEHELEQAEVCIELADGSRYTLATASAGARLRVLLAYVPYQRGRRRAEAAHRPDRSGSLDRDLGAGPRASGRLRPDAD